MSPFRKIGRSVHLERKTAMGRVIGLMVECLNGGAVRAVFFVTITSLFAIQARLHVTIIEETMCDFVLFSVLKGTHRSLQLGF